MEKKRKPLISIGIPTYNRADAYLKDALESALNQTYQNIEIVVSDNCSTDNTEELVTGYEDKRIKYFRHDENIGANNNFNYCIEQSNGAYFHMLHDDDLIDPDFLEVCMEAVDYDTSAGLIRTGMRVIDGQGAVVANRPNRVGGLSTTDFILAWFNDMTSPYLCNTLFNTSRLREVGGFHSKTHLWNDVVAEMKIIAKSPRIDVEEIKASFRDHGDNRGSAARLKEWLVDSKYLLDVLCEVVPENAKELVRTRGLHHFARLNYYKVKRLDEPMHKKFMAYWLIYKTFNFYHSPVHYMMPSLLKPHYWKKKVKNIMASPT